MQSDHFFRLVRAWLTVFLPRSRRLSPHTIRSYKTTLNLLIDYLRQTHKLSLQQVGFDQIDQTTVTGFTVWLTETRGAGPATVNQRLAAIKSFMAFCAGEDPALVACWLEIKRTRPARVPARPPDALPMAAVEALIAAPGQDSQRAVRDTTMILLMFDAAARIQEILDLSVGDIDTTPGRAAVTITGKGQKTRVVPIMDKTGRHLKQYTRLFHPDKPDPLALLFYTRRAGQPQKMSQDNVSYLLDKHAANSPADMSGNARTRPCPPATPRTGDADAPGRGATAPHQRIPRPRRHHHHQHLRHGRQPDGPPRDSAGGQRHARTRPALERRRRHDPPTRRTEITIPRNGGPTRHQPAATPNPRDNTIPGIFFVIADQR